MAITIIIPMRNEERYVGACLDSILGQIEGRDDVEVLCVDGRSADRTRTIVAEYSQRDTRVRLVDNPNGIVPTGMNLGIAEAHGEIIIRLDCHAEYAADYIDACVEVLERTASDNVGGYITTLPGKDSPVGRAIAAATSSRFGVGGSTFRVGGDEQEVDTVPFGCFRRDVFERFGPYDERLVRNQDIELNHRIRKRGGRVLISPRIRLTYYNRSTLAGLRQQAFNNGLWNPYNLYLGVGGPGLRHFIPLVFVLSIGVLAAGGVLWWPLWALLGLELLAYVTAGGYMAARAGRDVQASPPLVLIAFAQLHVSYGLGLLWGFLTAPVKFGLRPPAGPGQALAGRKD